MLGQYNEALRRLCRSNSHKTRLCRSLCESRSVANVQLGSIDEAQSDFKIALELAEHQGNDNLKVFVEEQLQQLDQVASRQNNKKPRRGGQWKGKVKIAEDFDELPESFTESLCGEDE